MSRRARPTLRVLREDLGAGWATPFTLRALGAGDIASVQPLHDLDHPVLQKASSSFSENPANDSFVGPIASMTSVELLEIKSGQWRAGVWIDDDACWVVAVGLAKGGHEDRDDFYQALERREDAGAISSLLPVTEDRDLLKKERADAIVSAWQLETQRRLLDALRDLAPGGVAEVMVPSPAPGAADGEVFAHLALEAVSPEDDYPYDDVTVEIEIDDRWKNTQLSWHLTVQVLATISPPVEDWDWAGGIFSALLEPGGLAVRAREVDELQSRGEIAQTAVGSRSHYTHRRNLAQRSVDGTAVRALCGAYFVPHRDPGSLAVCPVCQSLHSEIPSA